MESWLIELAKILTPVAICYIAFLKTKAELAAGIEQSKYDLNQAHGKIRELQGIPNAYRRDNASSTDRTAVQVHAGELQNQDSDGSSEKSSGVRK